MSVKFCEDTKTITTDAAGDDVDSISVSIDEDGTIYFEEASKFAYFWIAREDVKDFAAALVKLVS